MSKENPVPKFWIVMKWPPINNTRKRPYMCHYSFEAASAEAARLTTILPDDTFIVMEAMETCKAVSILKERL